MNINAIGSYVDSTVDRMAFANAASTGAATGNTNGGDSVSISSGAIRMDLLTNFMDGAGSDGVITLDEIRAFRDKQVALARNILRDTLDDLNITSSERLQIDIDPVDNNVVVTGSTGKNNEAIAAALQEDDQFRNVWNAASGCSSLIAAAEASTSFQNAYSSDATAAVAQYSWLIDKSLDFNMYFEGGEVDYSVT